jgi:MFS family permease
MVVGYSFIRDMYDAKQAGLYLGLTVTFMSIGRLIGPTLLGVVTDFAGWRAAYHVLWPLALLTAVLVMFGAKITSEEAKTIAIKIGSFDALGAVGITVFSIPLVIFITLGTTYVPYGSPISLLCMALTVTGLIILIVAIKKKGDGALIPAGVLKDRDTLLVTASLSFAGFANMAVSYFIPTYILYVMQGTATQAGLAGSLMTVLGVVLGPVLGRYVAKKMNARGLLSVGAIARILITIILIIFISPTMKISILLAIMFLAGFYNCIQSVAQSAVPQIVIKPELRVQSNSFIQVVTTCVQNCGTATYGAILGGYGIANGFKPAFYVSGVAAILSLLSALLLKKPSKPAE